MLSYALAIAVALSSLVLFLTAFLMSDIHRRDDFLWSGVGLFYALVLWFCARNITGAVLLGQAFASVLLVSFVWQTLKLRKAIANPAQAAAIDNFSLLQTVNNLSKRNQPQIKTSSNPSVSESDNVVTESKISIPQTTTTETQSSTSDSDTSSKKTNKFGSFNKLFGNGKKSTITNTKLDDILDDSKVVQTDKVAVQPVLTPLENKSNPREIPDSLDKEVKEIENRESQQIVSNNPVNKVLTEVTNDSDEAIEPEVKSSSTIEKELTINQELNISDLEKKVEKEPEEATAKNDHDVKPPSDLNRIKVDPEENTSTEIITKVQVVKSTIKKSPLDSLETVEVAEVLEALPENVSNERNSDQSNIIEVTTTEINKVTESQQSEKNPDSQET
jgi:hypothetical protein